MKITEIQIAPIKPRDGLVAFASVVLENRLYLGSIGVYTRLNGTGYRITYPTKKIGDRNTAKIKNFRSGERWFSMNNPIVWIIMQIVWYTVLTIITYFLIKIASK